MMNMKITVEFENKKQQNELDALLDEAMVVAKKCNETEAQYKHAIAEVGMAKVKAIKEQVQPLSELWVRVQELYKEVNWSVRSIMVSEYLDAKPYSTNKAHLKILADGTIRIGDSYNSHSIDMVLDGTSGGGDVLFGSCGVVTLWNEYDFATEMEQKIKGAIREVIAYKTEKIEQQKHNLNAMINK